jgi:dephospho-CoA kinase
MRGMSHWDGKYVIGLTGNIATGKSVVRRMLEHLGAYGIDADSLAHRMIDQGTPGYGRVVQVFGRDILGADEQINRGRLGKLVFSDPQALQELEAIVHPLVMEIIEWLMSQIRQPVVVIEAIKLIESGLNKNCDVLWVVDSKRDAQIQRLVQKRSFTHEGALQRIRAQPSQEIKLALADRIIVNNGAFTETWRQVKNSWETTIPPQFKEVLPTPEVSAITLRQTTPEQAEAITKWINFHTEEASSEGFAGRFAERTYLEIIQNGQTNGFVGWKTDNFIAIVSELYLDQTLNPENLLECFLGRLEEVANQNLCEVIVVSLPRGEAQIAEALGKRGYRMCPMNILPRRAWREAAAAQNIPDSTWWKPLNIALFVAQEQVERDRSA